MKLSEKLWKTVSEYEGYLTFVKILQTFDIFRISQEIEGAKDLTKKCKTRNY